MSRSGVYFSNTGWFVSTWTALVADCGEALCRFPPFSINRRAKLSPEYGSKIPDLQIRPIEQPFGPWIKMADFEQSSLRKSTFSSYCWKRSTLLAKWILLFFFQKQHDKALKQTPSQDYQMKKSFEKNLDIYVWKLLAPNIRKDVLSQSSKFSVFGCTMSNLITCLVMSFNLFAADDIFRIMVGKIQEGSEKFLMLIAKVLRCDIRLIDWLISSRNRLFLFKCDMVLWKLPTFNAVNGD